MHKLINIRTVLAGAIIVVSVLVAGTVAYRLTFRDKAPKTVKKLPPNVDVSMESARLVEEKDGKKLWEIEARSAQFDKKRNVTVLQSITSVIFSDRAPRRTTITSTTGEYDHDRKVVTLRGDVQAVSDGPVMTFRTDSLSYDGDRRILSSKDPVSYRDERLAVKGRGFEYGTESGILKIRSRVEATIGAKTAK